MIEVSQVSKEFGEPPVRVLADVDFTVEEGEFVALTGKSGSGKSTLLYIVSTLDNPSTGRVRIAGHDPATMADRELHLFRNSEVGFVFQFHHLLGELSVLENITLPGRKTGKHEELVDRALELLDEFELKNKSDRFPGQLSGGEQQRVALARALIMSPRYLFADEPTGNLDSKNGEIVMDFFRRINRDRGTTIIMVTHDRDFARIAGRGIELADGRVIRDGPSR